MTFAPSQECCLDIHLAWFLFNVFTPCYICHRSEEEAEVPPPSPTPTAKVGAKVAAAAQVNAHRTRDAYISYHVI